MDCKVQFPGRPLWQQFRLFAPRSHNQRDPYGRLIMIDLFYWPTPNGHKITMFLEEAGLDYRIHPVDISAGDQFKPEFLRISPNNRIPAIIDQDPIDGEPIPVFESGALSWFISPTRSANSYPPTCVGARRHWNGCSGRWEGSVPWPARIITSSSTPPSGSRMRWSVTSRKRTACTVCWTDVSKGARTSSARLIPSQTWRAIPG